MLVDTHAHINIMVKKEFDILLSPEDYEKAAQIVQEAAADGVTILLNVGTSLPESLNSIHLAQRFSHVYAAIGIHPSDIKESWKEELNHLELLIKEEQRHTSSSQTLAKIVGIGECGIDLYHTQNLAEQEEAFRRQIELALTYNLALVVHSRNAPEETLNVLTAYKDHPLRGTIHCFSYDRIMAQEFIKLGFHLGIGGTITYPKNNELREVVMQTPLERIVLETDAPFLPPQIMRGKPNHPKYIRLIAEYIAQLKNCTVEEVAIQTTKNAYALFNFSSSTDLR